VRQGQAVIDLHLWNEHLPPFPGAPNWDGRSAFGSSLWQACKG
jgi:hypothetical protein